MSALFLSNPEKNKEHRGLGVKAHGDKDHGMCSIHSEIPQTTPTLYEASLTAALLARDRQAYSSLTVGRCFTHGRNLVCMKHRRLSVLYYPSLTFPLTSSGALLEIPFAQPWRYLFSPPPNGCLWLAYGWEAGEFRVPAGMFMSQLKVVLNHTKLFDSSQHCPDSVYLSQFPPPSCGYVHNQSSSEHTGEPERSIPQRQVEKMIPIHCNVILKEYYKGPYSIIKKR